MCVPCHCIPPLETAELKTLLWLRGLNWVIDPEGGDWEPGSLLNLEVCFAAHSPSLTCPFSLSFPLHWSPFFLLQQTHLWGSWLGKSSWRSGVLPFPSASPPSQMSTVALIHCLSQAGVARWVLWVGTEVHLCAKTHRVYMYWGWARVGWDQRSPREPCTEDVMVVP